MKLWKTHFYREGRVATAHVSAPDGWSPDRVSRTMREKAGVEGCVLVESAKEPATPEYDLSPK